MLGGQGRIVGVLRSNAGLQRGAPGGFGRRPPAAGSSSGTARPAAPTLPGRVPVKWFEGGHMTHNTEASRPALEAAISDFYAAPPFGSDAAQIAQQADAN